MVPTNGNIYTFSDFTGQLSSLFAVPFNLQYSTFADSFLFVTFL